MEVRKGYKQTEVGVIPEDWEATIVREIASPIRNAIVGGPFGSDLVSNDYVDDGVPVIRGQNLGSKFISGDFVFVTEKKAKSLEANLAHPDDLVFTQRGTLGQVSLVPQKIYKQYLVSQSQMKLTVNRKLADPNFYYYLFTGSEQQKLIQENTIQTGVPHINLGILRLLPVQCPPLPEQKAIAEALSDADAFIEAVEQLLTKKRQVKQGAMSELLTGRRRLPGFSGEWNEKQLEDVIKEIGDGATPSTSNPLNFGGSIHWAVIDDIKDEITTTRSTLTERGLHSCPAKLWQPGTLIVSTGATIGEVGIARVPLATKQGICGIVVNNAMADTVFLKFWFVGNKSKLLAKAQGSTIKEVRAPTLVQFEISLPPIAEQTAIAEILSDMDAEISALEEKLVKARQVKAGMMSELLTGKIRLV
jgi:type I restriction enzyme S subunit